MLAAFLQTNTKNTSIHSVQADQIGRTYPPLFTLNLPISHIIHMSCCTDLFVERTNVYGHTLH